jgi:hypothetical protein
VPGSGPDRGALRGDLAGVQSGPERLAVCAAGSTLIRLTRNATIPRLNGLTPDSHTDLEASQLCDCSYPGALNAAIRERLCTIRDGRARTQGFSHSPLPASGS